jgi:hypothetical protein
VRLLLALALVAAAGCGPRIFVSRVDVQPLEQKLAAAGGDRSRIVRPTHARDLDVLLPGKPYRYIVDVGGRLAVAPLPNEALHNEYVHPVLGDGQPVRTAGMMRREAGGRIVIDQNSKSYCPTKPSLQAAVRALHAIGVADVVVEDHPPACVRPARPPAS